MKGIVFNVLERIIVTHHGEDAWETLLERSGIDGAYTSLGNYDDTQFTALVTRTAELMGTDEADCLCWIGRAMLPQFESLYPELIAQYPGPISMLAALNDVIHPEVVKLYPGADVPVFHYEEVGARRVVMEYHSSRALCALAHGLMLGTGDLFGEEVTVDQPECRHRGDARCLFTITIGADDD